MTTSPPGKRPIQVRLSYLAQRRSCWGRADTLQAWSTIHPKTNEGIGHKRSWRRHLIYGLSRRQPMREAGGLTGTIGCVHLQEKVSQRVMSWAQKSIPHSKTHQEPTSVSIAMVLSKHQKLQKNADSLFWDVFFGPLATCPYIQASCHSPLLLFCHALLAPALGKLPLAPSSAALFWASCHLPLLLPRFFGQVATCPFF